MWIVRDIASRRMRVPVSTKIALASPGATVGTLASPDTAWRLGRFDQVHFDRRYRLHAHDGIAIEVLRDDVAAIAQDDLTPGSGSKPPQDPALHLRADEVGIEDDAAGGDSRRPADTTRS